METTDSPKSFRFRLNCIDQYQATPSWLDPDLATVGQFDAPTVPVIRIFGATETGQKVCAHIHGALPYLYVAYNGSIEVDQVKTYIQTFATSTDHALALSYRHDAYQKRPKSYVAHISLVKGVPFYGYHVGYRHFLKVYLRNPANMTRLADLLGQGAILSRPMQPFESHLQYLLQWMCDYNLYGCGLIVCKKALFRQPFPESVDPRSYIGARELDPVLDSLDFPRQSHCAIEVDIQVQDILNRFDVQQRNIHQDFKERLLKTGPTDKFVPSMADLWRDETIRRKKRLGLNSMDPSPFPPEALATMSADSRLTRGNWVHEEEHLATIDNIIEAERKSEKPTFESFLQSQLRDSSAKSVYDSVEDLYTGNIASSLFYQSIHQQNKAATQPNVDENAIGELNDVLNNEAPQEEPVNILADDVKPIALVSRSKSGISEVGGESNHTHTRPQDNAKAATQLSQASIKASGTSKQRVVSFAVTKPNSGQSPVERTPLKRHNSLPELDQRPSKIVRIFPSTMDVGGKLQIQPEPVQSQDATFPKCAHLKLAPGARLMLFHRPSPSPSSITSKQFEMDPTATKYKAAFYSVASDAKDQPNVRPVEPLYDGFSDLDVGRKVHELNVLIGSATEDQAKSDKSESRKRKSDDSSFRCWQIGKPPPSVAFVNKWVLKKEANHQLLTKAPQTLNPPVKIKEPKAKNKSKGKKKAKSKAKASKKKQPANGHSSHKQGTQYMSVMSLEVHVRTRKDLVPDPAEDEICCIFWSVQMEAASTQLRSGIIMVVSEDESSAQFERLVGAEIHYETSELDAINNLVDIVRDIDPDILCGFEVQKSSWGYLIERARLKFEFEVCDELSRVNFGSKGRFGKDVDRWGYTKTSAIRITGRHMINIWRAMRSELNLLQYTMENVVFRVLHKRIPHYSFETLSRWFEECPLRDVAKVLNYFLQRTQLNLHLLGGVDLVAKTSEQARLLGVDFFSVISRGSQFKVESLMFRIAKPESYVLVSPSRKQVGQQNALECLPLVMEPQSNFYNYPVLVLDFQSLYPSIMIAYNYCYSTCLGRVSSWRGQNKMGFTEYDRESGILELLGDQVNVAPNGMIYVRPEVRRSLLAKMLTEILETRVMVKSGMKEDKKDRALQRLLNNRQLALKLIANVTYGYTSASFSGRLPCAEIADSIVQSGRETLERAIAIIHAEERWGAEVVYGDTDSLFVHLKGKSREEAFKIGKDIADTITKANPRPMKLKFEKVYHPCVLLAKKRYVGYKYEHPGQQKPEFDAKGIETVRRDGTPCEQRIEEKSLRLLFRTRDLSRVKAYFQKECSKIMIGQISIQDHIFSREVKLGSYSEKGPPPPGALISTRKMQDDPRKEPQYGERVPFVVIAGPPGSRLMDRCVDPDVLLHDDQVELDADYYISKNLIPPLHRIFSLVGANVKGWYDEMPKIQKLRALQLDPISDGDSAPEENVTGKKALEAYMNEKCCFICSAQFSMFDDMDDVSDSSDNEATDDEDTRGCESKQTNNDAITDDERYSFKNLEGVICKDCMRNIPASTHLLYTQQAAQETKVKQIDSLCQHCARLDHGESVECDSRDCPVYYVRTKETSNLRSLRTKVQVLMRKVRSDGNGNDELF
ncbi:hypothetical protein BT63DRAFT_474143 [Microthyrium microscopicum]|uniref:DNA polymerase n=1 Tax=Microthyrium microscopicum TaxID=703497 RepID=A0A6A6USM5_9PEZI|nr:hypothetical protein BT63DRAFT_474143 [Microthyrium microscopicum]